MKAGIFVLTKNEQRVVILLVVALLTGAFVRYWRDVNRDRAIKKSDATHATATPFSSPEEDVQLDPDETAADGARKNQMASPQSPP
jgi:hypothetical protein